MGLFLVGKPLAAEAGEVDWLVVQPLATWAMALWLIPHDTE